ncbi:GGDEF domain-containing protein [Kineococcus rhizosphaerae]|uniref:GGDEF domain-containing protein n=1 Tax=Kineococcus rhizosphaerae TaxID=559628 RepID=UPI000D080341|nr:GGDEF domain-containing protein [Kineococcus rhizosphaerae]
MAGQSTQRLPVLVAVALGVAVVVAVVWWLLPAEAVLAPWWTQVLGWPAILLVRSDLVQRALGGGRLDNRVWLRVALGGTLFALVLAPTGMGFLFPLYAVLVASVHLQWTGPGAWRASVTVTVLLSALLQLLVVRGLLPTLLPGTAGVMVMGTAVVASVAVAVNIALLAREREAGAAALERERRAHHAELLHAATHDALTGQLNRTGFQQAYDEMTGEQELAVLYVDLDRFKAVNDEHGHAAGDRLLRLATQRLTAHLRPGDRVARLGGDEFAVLVAGADRPVVAALARRAAAALEEPFDLGCAVVRISASIGVAHRDDCADGREDVSLEQVLHAADGDMYRVKALRSRRREGGGLTTTS